MLGQGYKMFTDDTILIVQNISGSNNSNNSDLSHSKWNIKSSAAHTTRRCSA